MTNNIFFSMRAKHFKMNLKSFIRFFTVFVFYVFQFLNEIFSCCFIVILICRTDLSGTKIKIIMDEGFCQPYVGHLGIEIDVMDDLLRLK